MSGAGTKIIAVVGPTSSGKSALGVLLAKKLNGEIISADSRQVYRGLNIGTGKITKKEMAGIPHHLLDVASPKRQLSADDFKHLATKKITMIYHSKKIPIVVGGTGFYVDALLGRLSLPEVPPNPGLRAKLEKKSLTQLLNQLKKLDPARAKTVEPHHKRRLIRAIEIAKGRSKRTSRGSESVVVARLRGIQPISSKKFAVPREIAFAQPNILWLGLYPGEQKLRENIRRRLASRLKAGMIAEARRLHAAGLSFKRMKELGLEYRFLAEHLEGTLNKQEMEEGLSRAIARYAKRQMRWFKRNPEIKWVSGEREALKLAQKFTGGR